jgi:chloramphenicol O-acetyltransferase
MERSWYSKNLISKFIELKLYISTMIIQKIEDFQQRVKNQRLIAHVNSKKFKYFE